MALSGGENALHPDDSDYVLDAPDQGWNHEPSRAEVFQQIDAPLYTTDADGWLTYYNDAAADLWGYRPELGKSRWCGSWRIFTPDGAPLPLDQCPMAVALKEGREVRGVQAVLERPDGTLIPFMPYPTPLRDPSGSIVAGANVLLKLPSPATPHTPDRAAEERADMLPDDLRAGLELDDLTGRLQATLAALADVEFGFQIDSSALRNGQGQPTRRSASSASLRASGRGSATCSTNDWISYSSVPRSSCRVVLALKPSLTLSVWPPAQDASHTTEGSLICRLLGPQSFA